jgi:Xaa-Pro aminopeptidase
VSEAVLIYADGERSMDLFAAVPAAIIDPYLYVELDGRRVAVISHIDQETIRAVDPGIEVRDPMDLGRRELLASGMDRTAVEFEVARRALAAEGVTSAVVNWDFPAAIADVLRADGIEVRPDHRVFERRRRVKTRLQVDGIRRAQHAADVAMGVAARMVRECEDGLTSEAVRSAMQAACAARDCTLGDDVIVGVGGQAANGHDSGSGPIAPGDCVLVDVWPRDKASRCWADMTRTFVAGGEDPPEELLGYWRLAREALERVTAEVRPGADGAVLHGIASQVFEDAGQPTLRTMPGGSMPDRGFLHSLGHGVGLAVHEAPALGLSGDPLLEGDVIAVEPGCYRQGFGGVRLEDLLLVTSAGCEVLTDFPYDL